MYIKQKLSTNAIKGWLAALLALSLLAGCAQAPLAPASSPTPAATATVPAAPTGASPAASLPTQCALAPIVAPTLPAVIPGYTELDPATDLHMTGDYQVLDLASYRLTITGKVDRPQVFSYDQLRCMPKVTGQPVLDCPGYFTDVANWSGVSLDYLLQLVGVQKDSYSLDLVSADGYYATVSLADVSVSQPFLAYEWEGQPLPVLHGFPLRAILPGMAGGKWVKWLVKIEVN